MRTNIYLSLLAGVCWTGVVVANQLDLFPELPILLQALHVIALGVSSVVAVRVAAHLLVNVLLGDVLSVPVSNIMKTTVYSTAFVIALLIILPRMGVDVGPILTTSAILGAILGLALQPTLGSLFAGLAITSDRTLMIGDTIDFEDRPATVTAIGWRHIEFQRSNGQIVRIPNAKIAASTLKIYPETGSITHCVTFPVAADIPPNRIRALVTEALSDVAHVDTRQNIAVYPDRVLTETGVIEYAIMINLRDYKDKLEILGEIRTRIWYALDRAGITFPHNRLYTRAEEPRPISAQHIQNCFPSLPPELAETLSTSGAVMRFGRGENIQFPDGANFAGVALLSGELCHCQNHYLDVMEFGANSRPFLPNLSVQAPSRNTDLHLIAGELAISLGPAAERVMQQEVERHDDRAHLITALGTYIENDAERNRFFHKTARYDANGQYTGVLLPLRKDIMGRKATVPRLQAASEVVLIALLPEHYALMEHQP